MTDIWYQARGLTAAQQVTCSLVPSKGVDSCTTDDMLSYTNDKTAGLDSGDRPTQLRDLAAALRKAEEVDDKLRALRNLEGALLVAPDELKHYAGELTLFFNP